MVGGANLVPLRLPPGVTQHLTEGLYVLHVHEVLCEDPVRLNHFPPRHLGGGGSMDTFLEDVVLTSVGVVNDWQP